MTASGRNKPSSEVKAALSLNLIRKEAIEIYNNIQ